MTPKMVIFDCDGVLVDSEPITNKILRDDLASRGLDLSLTQVMDLFVGGTIAGAGDEARKMGADIGQNWVSEIYEVMYAKLAENTPLIPDVELVLEHLDEAGIKYAVGSNGAERKMAITIGQHPDVWRRLKDKLYSAATYGAAKPDPTIYLAAARDANLGPSECVVVDDSRSGCLAAQNAGMRCLGFAEHDDGARLKEVGAEIVHNMQDVLNVLRV